MKSIGLDIGTTTICGILMDAANGELIKKITLPNDSAIEGKTAFEKLQDPKKIEEKCQWIVETLASEAEDLVTIGVTGQMHGIVYLNQAGEAVSPLYSWQDGRGGQIYQDGKTYAETLSEQSGYRLATGFGAVTHYYNTQNQLIPNDAHSFCKDILSWQINNKLEKPILFDDLIKAGLRNNPDWIIISETRGSEAYAMLKSSLSGHNIITTIHSNNAKSNVERIIHMCKENYNLDQNLLGNMICDNFDIGIHLDHYIDDYGVKRFISEVVEYVSYGKDGTKINPLFTRITNITKRGGRYFYDVNYKYGKMTRRLFDKLARAKVLSSDIDRFIKEEYFEEKSFRDSK